MSKFDDIYDKWLNVPITNDNIDDWCNDVDYLCDNLTNPDIKCERL